MTEVNSNAIKKLERDWRSMIFISHDFFHRWRMVLEEKFGAEETLALVDRFWESVGEGTAVNAFVRASLVMGESARSAKEGNDVLLIHDACPWIGSYKDYGAPGQCQAGCDKWFETALKAISSDFSVQTDSCLAAGESTCTRRYSNKNIG